ncbi:MAG: response regulator transcription factor [Planctomycetota bacterium]|jgi:DNA-binding response OmpR family regulator|nr:response regulator transcription factor [Planctomycetota bacterium]
MAKVLVIDDDHELFRLLADYLGGEEYECAHAADAESAMEVLRGGEWDAVILDVMLPGADGFTLLRGMRSEERYAKMPVMMLSARGEEADRVTGLELGADDYLAKPFSARELAARLRALLRRAGRIGAEMSTGDLLRLDDLAINRTALSVSVGDDRISITASELRLLEIFTENPGQVVDRVDLYQKLFGHPPFFADRGLDMLVSRVRKKLGPRRDGGERIRAARGRGYVFLLTEDQA